MDKVNIQNILVICKYHGATSHRGSRVSFRLGLPESKQRFIGYNHALSNITDMVAEYIDSELGISPLAQVQNKETPSLVYAWDSKFFDFVGLKKRGF